MGVFSGSAVVSFIPEVITEKTQSSVNASNGCLVGVIPDLKRVEYLIVDADHFSPATCPVATAHDRIEKRNEHAH